MKRWLLLTVASALANTGLAQPAQVAGQAASPLNAAQQEHRSAIPLIPSEKRLAAPTFSMQMLASDRIDPDYPGLPLGIAVAAIQKFVADKKGNSNRRLITTAERPRPWTKKSSATQA